MNYLKQNLPAPLIIGLAFPIIILIYFYISYASNAWFWQDDFVLISYYANSIQIHELFDFTNFGRFLSRNLYWHWGIQYFSYNAGYFYVFNLFVISSTSFLLYKIFSPKYGRYEGIIAGLIYFTLPETIECYSWLSNSQHIIGHFFVVLFVFLFTSNDLALNIREKFFQTTALLVILALGFSANIFMSMVISLPIYMILANKIYRKSKSTYIILFFGIGLFALFFIKLSSQQTGAYATSHTLGTLIENIDFYFKNSIYGIFWLTSVILGAGYSFIKKEYFTSWLFLASAAFFVPFAFFIYQRYGQYGDLTYLFFLLGVWALLNDVLQKRWPKFIKYLGLCMILFIFFKSLEHPIRYFTENPSGATQRQQINFLKTFDTAHADTKNYCFRPDVAVKNTTNVKIWGIPADWWFVGFGRAFSLFVNHDKTYELVQNANHCDVNFVFKNGRLEITNTH